MYTAATGKASRIQMNVCKQDVKAALETLLRLDGKYPSDAQLLENRRNAVSSVVYRGTDPERLPFNLDRIRNTWAKTRTFGGVCAVLARVCRAWGVYLAVPGAGTPRTYRECALWLLTNLGRWEDLPGDLGSDTGALLVKTAADAKQICGYGEEKTVYRCLNCTRGQLVCPYTAQGIMEVYVCVKCGSVFTPGQYLQMAKLAAVYGDADMAVTQSEAAFILGENVKAINARIRRGKIRPVKGGGRNALYRLKEIKK